MKRFIILSLLASLFLGSYAMIPQVVKIYDESEISELLDMGVEISRRRGDILLCLFPDEIAEISSTKTRSLNSFNNSLNRNRNKRIITPTLDESVKYMDAYTIQSGEALGYPLTGKGIVVGFCDVGFDPLHPTFLDNEGKSRVRQITHYNELEGKRLVLTTDEQYRNWKTDDPYNYHATHVAGILAGNGAGSPYKGIAYDADIVASVSLLSEYSLLMGVEDIIDYAKSVDKKAVVNISMGSFTGPHDGTSLFNQYLDMCADDAIIVLSAGNEGSHYNSIQHTFSEDMPEVYVRLGNSSWIQNSMYGETDIWGETDSPLTMTLSIYDDKSYKKVMDIGTFSPEEWEVNTIKFDPSSPYFEGCSLKGYMDIMGGVDPENGRYMIKLAYEYVAEIPDDMGWAKDVIGLSVKGENGSEVFIFSDGGYTRLMSQKPGPDPTTDWSISDLACGHRIISVGQYGNRSTCPITFFTPGSSLVMDQITGFEPFIIDKASSYGTLKDGRSLPLTVAPGGSTMSSLSRYYFTTYPYDPSFIDEKGTPWKSLGGTSMTAPYVAGYIATWLQQLPDLTSEQIMEAILATNSMEIPDPENPRNANGYFNPVAALNYLLATEGVETLQTPETSLSPDDYVEVYNLSGITVYKGKAEGCNNLRPSVYIVRTPFGSLKRTLPGLIFHK